ncbi:MAG: hypothetical protein ACXWCV_00360 [Caldimonas sp.]
MAGMVRGCSDCGKTNEIPRCAAHGIDWFQKTSSTMEPLGQARVVRPLRRRHLMSDEFDDLPEHRPPLAGSKLYRTAAADSTPRLVGRLYAASDRGARARLLVCLLRPLSPLGRAAVAAGVFAKFVTTDSFETLMVSMDEATRFSSDQIAELARFVQQVSPQALEQFARLAADNRMGMTAFGIAAASLLLKSLSQARA